jgi:hypothetical protein
MTVGGNQNKFEIKDAFTTWWFAIRCKLFAGDLTDWLEDPNGYTSSADIEYSEPNGHSYLGDIDVPVDFIGYDPDRAAGKKLAVPSISKYDGFEPSVGSTMFSLTHKINADIAPMVVRGAVIQRPTTHFTWTNAGSPSVGRITLLDAWTANEQYLDVWYATRL